MSELNWDERAKLFGYNSEQEMFEDLYVGCDLSIAEIAGRLGVGTATVGKRLNRCNIQPRPKGGANNQKRMGKILHRLDQRVVYFNPTGTIAELLGISNSLVYKYKRYMEGFHGILYHQPDRGVEPVFDPLETPSGITTGTVSLVQRLLRQKKESG